MNEVPDFSADTTITYTVRELLAEQTGLLRSIDHKVDTKADKSDLVALEVAFDKRVSALKANTDARLEIHTDAIADIREKVVEATTLQSAKRRVWAVVGSVGGLIAVLVGALISSHVH